MDADYQEKIQLVQAFTGYVDVPTIAAALRREQGDTEAVINMILDDKDKVRFQSATPKGSI